VRVLLDECLPRRLKRELVGHDARTAPEMGWASKRNGELLVLAAGQFEGFEHEPYMRAVGVQPGENAYPGFSDDSLEAFRHLRTDLHRFGHDFLAGDASILIRAASEEASRRSELQRRQMASYTGDDADRRRARELFRAKDYVEVVSVLDALKYPEFMDDFERKILEVARRKTFDR
jgi:hypothetical protein